MNWPKLSLMISESQKSRKQDSGKQPDFCSGKHTPRAPHNSTRTYQVSTACTALYPEIAFENHVVILEISEEQLFLRPLDTSGFLPEVK